MYISSNSSKSLVLYKLIFIFSLCQIPERTLLTDTETQQQQQQQQQHDDQETTLTTGSVFCSGPEQLQITRSCMNNEVTILQINPMNFPISLIYLF